MPWTASSRRSEAGGSCGQAPDLGPGHDARERLQDLSFKDLFRHVLVEAIGGVWSVGIFNPTNPFSESVLDLGPQRDDADTPKGRVLDRDVDAEDLAAVHAFADVDLTDFPPLRIGLLVVDVLEVDSKDSRLTVIIAGDCLG